jgi:hypothetical protein
MCCAELSRQLGPVSAQFCSKSKPRRYIVCHTPFRIISSPPRSLRIVIVVASFNEDHYVEASSIGLSNRTCHTSQLHVCKEST